MGRCVPALAAGVSALAGVSCACGQATFQGLGFFAGAQNLASEATAVSPNGQYVAGRGFMHWSVFDMFVWTEAGGMGAPIVSSCSCHVRANAIADDGRAAAGYEKFGAGIGPVRWDPVQAFVYIPGPPSVGDGIAFDMSADGSVVVGEHDNPAHMHAFRYVNGVVDHFMGTPFFENSIAKAVTPDGTVIVGSASAGVFRWREATGAVYIPEQPWVGTTIIEGVNQDGNVIVGWRFGPEPTAGRWVGDTWSDLAGPVPSRAWAVSGDGRRVIGASGPQFAVATIWDDWKVGVPLADALIEAGASIPAGWVLTQVADISLDGRVIVGSGTDPQGRTQAWRATLPRLCYANCDSSTATPVLNVADFTCFLQGFAAGMNYANCDGSTNAPVLNVADFTCFLQRFAAGCP